MKQVIPVYKPIGATPLQIIGELKKRFAQYADAKITYAGRLDPMAHGLLLLLSGAAISEKNQYLNLPKTYEFQMIFGIETDTYDILGKIVHTKEAVPEKKHLDQLMQSLVGSHSQPYPPFSSKPVQGKPLFEWAKSDKLNTIEIPHKQIEIVKAACHSLDTQPMAEVQNIIQQRVELVSGDFRQEEIKQGWMKFFRETKRNNGVIAHCSVTASSGTYVRNLVHTIGQHLGLYATALDIKRTAIGSLVLDDKETLYL